MTHSIQLDISADCPHVVLLQDTKNYDISIKLITFIGPGGGNPVYEFFGKYENLVKFCNEYDFPTEYIEKV